MKIIIDKGKIIAISIISLLLLFFIMGVFFIDFVYVIDEGILTFIRQFVSNDIADIMKLISGTCSATFLCILCIIFILFIKKKKIGLVISLNLFTVVCLNYILKLIFGRQRPIELMIIDETGYSFPSGHAMTSIAFYGFLIYLIYKYIKVKYVKNIIILFLSLLIALVGFSRLCLGVHYPSDVLVGFTVGYIYLKIFIEIIKNKKIID